MSDSTLAQIKTMVRRLTASPSVNQLSESDLEHSIDTVYEQDFPSHLKTWNLHSKLEFYTKPNEDRYDFDTSLYHAVLPPVYIDGYQSFYTQSREEFFRVYPELVTEFTGSVGDGSAGPYSFTISNTPILKRNVVLSVIDTAGNTLTAYDRPQTANNTLGDLIDADTGAALTGSINYVTGAVTITWTNTIPTTQSTTARFTAYQASRPASMLFFQNYFTLRPVPDKAYKVSVEVYQKPSQLLSANNHAAANTPDVNQWWQYIAYLAAKRILVLRQDMESVQNIMPFLKEQENLVIYRTATQQVPERTATIYTGMLNAQVGNRSWGGQ